VKAFLSLVTLVLLGFFIRVLGIYWDQGTFMHPDERFLVMVAQELKIPKNLNEYFSSDSPLRVKNTSYQFYVYGSFPLTVIKVIAQLTHTKDAFLPFVLLGRTINIILETGTIVLVFLLARYFTQKFNLPKKTSLWATLIYALMVLPIQLSHFFTVDPFVTFFCLASLLSIFAAIKKSNNIFIEIFFIQLAGIFWGMALASKSSAIYYAPLLAAVFIWQTVLNKKKLWQSIWLLLRNGLFFGLVSYVTLRILNPDYFFNNSWLDPQISPAFIKNLQTLQSWSKPDTWFPPSMQWLDRTPILFSLKNMVFFGIGIWQSLLILIGWLWLTIKRPKTFLSILSIWIILFICWQGSQFTQNLRYFAMLYPFFAFFGGLGAARIQQTIGNKKPFTTAIVLIIIIMFWPLMFTNIFVKPFTRAEATRWIYQNVPNNSMILYEYWDDSLPLAYVPGKINNYQAKAISVFDQDSTQKWETINYELANADYYILSSNRAWASISRIPNRYPQTSIFYQNLFGGETNYQMEKVFQTSPSLEWLGIPVTIDDQWAEEAFTVYDHPTVYIFRNKSKN